MWSWWKSFYGLYFKSSNCAKFVQSILKFLKNLIYLYIFLGPLVGYLGCKFGVRAVSAFGALIGAIAVGACFFAESISLVTFLYGVIFGKYKF